MTIDIDRPESPQRTADRSPGPRRVWHRFTVWQLVVMALATIAPIVVGGTIAAAFVGLISTHAMVETALVAAENPGIVTFGAMFLCSPIQWLTGRSQVRLRKYLGIIFSLLAFTNAAMFVIERGVAQMLAQPFLVAGTIAVAATVPLFLTSNRWSQMRLRMRRWRLLHRLTYLVAAALFLHVLLIPDAGPGVVMIASGFVARIPAVRRRLTAWGHERRARTGRPRRVVASRTASTW